MPSKPLPISFHAWHQENLIWRFTLADGALGRKSIQGIIQARLEGSSGGFAAPDILETPQKALDDIINRIGFRAAGRVRMIDAALHELSDQDREILAAVYSVPPQLGLEAWDLLANLVIFSEIAHKKYAQSRVKMAFFEWIVRLSQRKIGVVGHDKHRAPPRASRFELSLHRKINDECESMLEMSLQKYVDAFRLVGVGSLIQRVLRKNGRRHG